jgi:hypothetical protein
MATRTVEDRWRVESYRAACTFPLDCAKTEQEAISYAIRHSEYLFEWERNHCTATRVNGKNGRR